MKDAPPSFIEALLRAAPEVARKRGHYRKYPLQVALEREAHEETIHLLRKAAPAAAAWCDLFEACGGGARGESACDWDVALRIATDHTNTVAEPDQDGWLALRWAAANGAPAGVTRSLVAAAPHTMQTIHDAIDLRLWDHVVQLLDTDAGGLKVALAWDEFGRSAFWHAVALRHPPAPPALMARLHTEEQIALDTEETERTPRVMFGLTQALQLCLWDIVDTLLKIEPRGADRMASSTNISVDDFAQAQQREVPAGTFAALSEAYPAVAAGFRLLRACGGCNYTAVPERHGLRWCAPTAEDSASTHECTASVVQWEGTTSEVERIVRSEHGSAAARAVDESGWQRTPLHHAVANSAPAQVIELLLEAAPDVLRIRDATGRFPLQLLTTANEEIKAKLVHGFPGSDDLLLLLRACGVGHEVSDWAAVDCMIATWEEPRVSAAVALADPHRRRVERDGTSSISTSHPARRTRRQHWRRGAAAYGDATLLTEVVLAEAPESTLCSLLHAWPTAAAEPMPDGKLLQEWAESKDNTSFALALRSSFPAGAASLALLTALVELLLCELTEDAVSRVRGILAADGGDPQAACLPLLCPAWVMDGTGKEHASALQARAMQASGAGLRLCIDCRPGQLSAMSTRRSVAPLSMLPLQFCLRMRVPDDVTTSVLEAYPAAAIPTLRMLHHGEAATQCPSALRCSDSMFDVLCATAPPAASHRARMLRQCTQGNWDTAAAALQENPDAAAARDTRGWAPLHWALHGHVSPRSSA